MGEAASNSHGGIVFLSVPRRRLAALASAACLTAMLVGVAATPAAAAGAGYVRLAHLSPDTPKVDVYLSSRSGAVKPQRFPGVGYGVLSDYLRLPTGTYLVAMRRAGAPASEKPVLTTLVTVANGKAYTVAGVGRFADLGLRVLEDDLTLPGDDRAKVRIVQASVRAPLLDVSVANGPTIAESIAFATTTDYQLVDRGRWRLVVSPAGGGSPTELDALLGAGNVYSLLVLDASGGGLTAQLRTDATRAGDVPVGGVETGAGGGRTASPSLPLVGASALLLLVGGLAGRAAALRVRRLNARRL
jgi:hypothetical protein